VASESFLSIFRSLHGFEGDEAAFRSWVFTIVHHRLIDERRRADRRPRTESVDEVGEIVSGDVAAIVGKRAGAVRSLQYRGIQAQRRQLDEHGSLSTRPGRDDP